MGRFSPADRVRKRSEFRDAQGHGRRATSRHFVVLVFAREEHDESAETHGRTRLGLVVSRKVGNAVRRNRVKRLIREAFRHCTEWRLPNLDLVVIPRRLPARLGMQLVLSEFRELTPALQQRAAQAENDRKIRQSKLAAGPQTTQTGARRP